MAHLNPFAMRAQEKLAFFDESQLDPFKLVQNSNRATETSLCGAKT